MPTRILLVGGGGREHALAWKLGREPGVNEVTVAPGSDAIALESRVRTARDVDPLDGQALVALARRSAAELVVIGPEAPLAAGVVDALQAAGIATFGPTRAAARIESSKAFCREVAEAAGVPMARGRAFDDPSAARAFAAGLVADAGGVVVKADGLAGGKGVTVCVDLAAAESAIEALFAADAGARVVVEERLSAFRRRATTSGSGTATRAPTRAGWVPSARCPTCRTRPPSSCSCPSTGRCSRSSRGAERRSGEPSMRA
jgi:phosphoribosylamine--glycine ligase